MQLILGSTNGIVGLVIMPDSSIKRLHVAHIANYYRLDQNVEEALCQFKEYIYYIHCKNYLPDDKKVRYVELGKGIINFKKVIKKIGQNFTHLIFSLETHEREPSKKRIL
ncbi:sugar phosphate isomerase/epimerase [Streptococcus pseudoporcinus]|nr:sugar phosphate isomerase/epimerase [Streptococcus pseudoporcinus]